MEITRETVTPIFTALRYDNIDPQTGEVNLTKLTEEIAYELNLYDEDGFTIPDSLFEFVFELNVEFETQG